MKVIFITVLLFVSLLLFQIFTGIYLFYEKYGFSTTSISQYILGNPEKFINPKSLTGLIEVAMPHFLTVFLTVFFIAHIFYFFKMRMNYFSVAGITFLSGFLDIISNFLILEVSRNFAILKLVSFFGFEAGIFTLILLLFFNIFQKFGK